MRVVERDERWFGRRVRDDVFAQRFAHISVVHLYLSLSGGRMVLLFKFASKRFTFEVEAIM